MDTEDPKYKRAQARVKQLRHFYTSVVTFVFVNILLVIINYFSDPTNLWFYWVTAIWGLVLIVQAVNTFTIRNKQIGDDWEERKIKELLEKEKNKER